MSDNWVVGNLQNALDTWNAKVTELWNLILTSPQNFKGGGIWTAITNVNTAMQALGTGLLVLFFVIGVVKTCGSFTDLKKPEHAVKLFVRFILAKAVITQGMELMTTLFGIVQSGIASIMTAAGVSSARTPYCRTTWYPLSKTADFGRVFPCGRSRLSADCSSP